MNDTMVKNKKYKGIMIEPLVDEKGVTSRFKNRLLDNLVISFFIFYSFLPFTLIKSKPYRGPIVVTSQESIDNNIIKLNGSGSYINLNDMSYGEILDQNPNIEPRHKVMLLKIIKNLYKKLPNKEFPYLKANLYTLTIEGKEVMDSDALYWRISNTIEYDLQLSDNQLERVLAHEFAHMMNRHYNPETKQFHLGFAIYKDRLEFGKGLEEGMATFFREYITNQKFSQCTITSYPLEFTAIRALMEIIGFEKMFDYYLTSDIDGLIEELTAINGSKEKAINLIKNLDDLLSMSKMKVDYKVIRQSESKKYTEQALIDYFVTKYIMDIDMGIYGPEDFDILNYKLDYFHHLLYSEGSVHNLLSNHYNIIMAKEEIIRFYYEKYNIPYKETDIQAYLRRDIEYNRVYSIVQAEHLEVCLAEPMEVIFYENQHINNGPKLVKRIKYN